MHINDKITNFKMPPHAVEFASHNLYIQMETT